MILDYAVYKPKSGKVKNVVILLHGVGADGENLIGVAPYLADELPDTVFISPNAPFEFDMFPGSGGYQWFTLADRNPKTMLEGARKVEPIVNQFIDEALAEYNLLPANLVLLGFSQGTMVSLFVAPRRAKRIAAIVGFSGALLSPELLTAETKSKPDICLIHGMEDDVVPFNLMADAEKNLRAAGFNVEAHARPGLPHSMDIEGIETASRFLKKHLI